MLSLAAYFAIFKQRSYQLAHMIVLISPDVACKPGFDQFFFHFFLIMDGSSFDMDLSNGILT